MTVRYRSRALGATLLVAALAAPPGIAHAAEPATLLLRQARADVAVHDLGGDGIGPGDLHTWIAPVTAADGRSGTVVGEHVIAAIPADGPFRQVRLATSVIDLGNDDTIALAGLVPATTPLGETEPAAEVANAIIGGTGAFAGAKGEVRSVHAADGSWPHRLTYQTADPTATLIRELERRGG